MKKLNKKNSIIAAVLITLFIAASFQFYQTNIEKNLDESIKLTLSEVANQQEFNFETFVSSNMNQLDIVAKSISLMANGDEISQIEEDVSIYMKTLKNSFAYEEIFVIQSDGSILTADNTALNISSTEFFEETYKAEPLITGIMQSPVTNNRCVFFSEPILNENGKHIGTLILEVPLETINALLLPSFESSSTTILLDLSGHVIAVSDNERGIKHDTDMTEYLLSITSDTASENSQFFDSLGSGDLSGYVSYNALGLESKIIFTRLDNANWTMVITVPELVISKNANAIVTHTTLFLLELVIILFAIWLRLITINKNHMKELTQTAYYDELTGLINEKKFKIEMEKTLKKQPSTQFSIIKFDIVNFKVVNKIFGFSTGNKIIQAVAESSVIASSGEDTLFTRINSDEFLIFARRDFVQDINKLKHIFEIDINKKIKKICGNTFKFRGSRYIIPHGETNADDIVDTIELTHNQSKGQPCDIIFDYDENLKTQLVHTAYVCDRMYTALINKEYQIYLQPKYRFEGEQLCGAEALVRWKRPSGEFLYPNEFIPIFEQEGFIVELDKYMLRGVCELINKFATMGYKQIPISLNFSRMHMLDENFAKDITEIVDEYGVPHNLIELEMTETSMIDKEEEFKELFEELHARGFTLSMDDFGAGYSSLALLSELKFDIIKFDKSLLAKALDNNNSALVIWSMVDMSKQLNLKTLCEGVETIEQAEFLKNAGCDLGQGYLYSKPIPTEEFEKIMKMTNDM